MQIFYFSDGQNKHKYIFTKKKSIANYMFCFSLLKMSKHNTILKFCS